MNDYYINPEWKEFLEANNSSTFDELWDRQDPWFEEPNSGRSKDGWSGVCRIEIDNKVFFLKKQENFFTYSLIKPFGESVVQREFNNLQSFNELNIPSMSVVYFGVRKEDGKVQGMIMTEALEGYISIHEAFEIWKKNPCSLERKREILKEMARLIRDAHEKGVMHNSLYPKHIFIEENFAIGEAPKQEPLTRFIDLEKAKSAKTGSKKQLRDLDTLNRRSRYWTQTDRLAFLRYYLKENKWKRKVRKFLAKFQKVSKK